MRVLRDRLNGVGTEIWVGRAIVPQLCAWDGGGQGRKAVVVGDRRVQRIARNVSRALRGAGWRVLGLSVEAGESLKKLSSLDRIYGTLAAKGCSRDSVIFAVGGGTVTDTAGFIAATYMRGIKWVSVPTTLLGQVDSAIGGKTAINHRLGKNLIGAFHRPSLVVCDTGLLESLPPREIVSGAGEVVKYAHAMDLGLFNVIDSDFECLFESSSEKMEKIIHRCASLKLKTVMRDERDIKGIRQILNFGHTFAHALERTASFGYFRHGEAVIWGMRMAVTLSELAGGLRSHEGLKALGLLGRFSGRFEIPKLPRNTTARKMFSAMKFDKKKKKDSLTFVLLKSIGNARRAEGVNAKHVLEAMRAHGVR